MAAVTQTISTFPGGDVSLTWDDVTFVISQLAWTVTTGTLLLQISQTGKITSISANLTSSGSKNLSVLGLTTSAGGKGGGQSDALFQMSWVP